MKYYLAIDGGGTKTSTLCVDEMGKVVGEGQSGPTNLTVIGVGAASFNLKEGIRQATEKLEAGFVITKLVMGVAGVDTNEEHDRAQALFSEVVRFFPIEQFELYNDVIIALESGTDDQNAVALIAGTGSNCYGRNAQGQIAKTGGMDYLLSDQGSGYSLGRALLRTVVKSYDGRSEKSQLLEDLVKQHFALDDLSQLKNVVYNPDLTKTEVAELAKLVFEAQSQGELVAQRVLDHAIDDLMIMAQTVIRKLGLEAAPMTVVLVGSVAKHDYIYPQLEQKLKSLNPQIQLVVPDQPPVYGALKLAMS